MLDIIIRICKTFTLATVINQNSFFKTIDVNIIFINHFEKSLYITSKMLEKELSLMLIKANLWKIKFRYV